MVPDVWRHANGRIIRRPVAVETPAGKFKVIKIRRTDYASATFQFTYFYSPETKSVVKLTSDLFVRGDLDAHYEMELIEHGYEAPIIRTPMVKAPK